MTVCDLCIYEIPSSCDGKPCTMCPAETNTEIKSIPLSVLDKIKEEIEQKAYPIVHGVNNHEKGMTLYGILQIIDKCMVDSEDT